MRFCYRNSYRRLRGLEGAAAFPPCGSLRNSREPGNDQRERGPLNAIWLEGSDVRERERKKEQEKERREGRSEGRKEGKQNFDCSFAIRIDMIRPLISNKETSGYQLKVNSEICVNLSWIAKNNSAGVYLKKGQWFDNNKISLC